MRQTRNIYLAPIILVILGFFFYYGANIENAPIKAVGALIVAACFIPHLIFIFEQSNLRKPSEAMPFMPIMATIYAVYFGLSAITTESFILDEKRGVPDHLILEAAYLCLQGWCCLLVSYYLIFRVIRIGKPIKVEIAPNSAKKGAFGLIFVGFMVSVLEKKFNLQLSIGGQVVFILRGLADLGIGILIVLSARKKLEPLSNAAFWYFLLPLVFFLKMGTGSTTAMLALGIAIFMLFWATAMKVPWVLILLLLAGAILTRGNATEFRKTVWYGTNQTKTTIEKSAAYFQIIQKNLKEDTKSTVVNSVEVTKERAQQITIFGHVLSMCPSIVPYWGGGDYLTFPLTLIPRMIWRNKPKKMMGQKFGHAFKILAAEDKDTAINLPLVIEFYINFGATGVWWGMFFLGFVYRLMANCINRKNCGDGTLIVAAYIYSNIANIDSDFSLIFGSVVQQVLVLVFIFKVINIEGKASKSFKPS